MKVLTTLTISGGLNLSSNAKDTFSIGTPLEHNDGLVDDLLVYANADFKNNVILGSSSVDTVTANAKITASAGLFLDNCSLNITGGTIFVNGQDLLGDQGGGGGGSISSVETTGSGESIVRDVNNGTAYLRSLKSTSTINVNQQTKELEFEVNSNLTLTSITSQGTLTVSGNVQLNDSSSDVTTVQGALRLVPHDPLPAGEQGRLSVSGSNLYFHNGEQWKVVTIDVDQTAWTTYTPTWTAATTNPTLGNGTLTGAYKQIGKTVFVRVKLSWGSTTTGGSGDWRFSLPVTAASADGIQFPCTMLDNGVNWYEGTVNGAYANNTTYSVIIAKATNQAYSGGVNATLPFNWGSTDSLQFNGSYEAA